MEERSHIDRVVVVRLGLEGRNPEALQRINDHIASTQGGGVLGRLLIEWLLNLIDHNDPLVTTGLPALPDRQQQGEAVLEWGWKLWVRFANTKLGARIDTEIDLANVRSQRSGLDENPEITALWEMLQGGFKEKPTDPYPVAWIHDEHHDVIAVRQRAFYRLASSLGYVLPGGEKGTIDLLKEWYTPLPGETTYYKAFPGGSTERVRALRLVGVLNHAREAGVEIDGRQPWAT